MRVRSSSGLGCFLFAVLLSASPACSYAAESKPTTPEESAALAVPNVANRDTSKASVGADYVSPVAQPFTFFLDVHTRPIVAPWRPGDPIKEIPRRRSDAEVHGKPVNPTPEVLDPLAELQRVLGGTRSGRAFVTPLFNIAGIGDQGVSPPDTTGDIGTTHYVQSVNGSGGALYNIYNKTTGALVAGPLSIDALGAAPCNSGNGDPVVLFDELANRWVLTEFESNSNNLCVFISQGADPTVGTWTQYAFLFSAFPDYPKYAVWPDAYLLGANVSFGGGRAVCGLDRVKMLAGQPATMQCKGVPNLAGLGFQMLVPVDIDGQTLPPAGAPGMFVRHRDDELNNPGANDPTKDFLELYQLTVDWTTPANTTLSAVNNIPVTEFSSVFSINGSFGQGFGALPQPNGNAATLGTSTLDPLLEVVMFRATYRNFGAYESLVLNHVTDTLNSATADVAGVRWYELRRTSGIAASAWSKFMEGTYSPDTADRWMGGIAEDTAGNLALGFSIVHDDNTSNPAEPVGDIPAGMRYVGRLAGDTPGVMSTAETVIQNGTGTQGNDRWGDYSQMSVDPVDGCTFWFTSEYMTGASKSTRVASFRHDACGTPTFTINATPTTQSVCANPSATLAPVNVTIGSVSGYVTPVALGFGAGLPPGFSGSYTVTPVTPPGASVANLSVTNVAPPGPNFVTLRGSSAGTDKDVQLTVNVVTLAAATPSLVSPANNAVGVLFSPVLTWSAVAQAATYTVEVATDAAFTTIVRTATVTGTSTTVTPALNANTVYFWRVRATNACATSVNSTVFQFTTALTPDQCPTGTTVQNVFGPENMDGTAVAAVPTGWVATGGTALPAGSMWGVQAEQPASGANSLRSRDITSVNDRNVTTPSIVIPSGQDPVTLQFKHVRNIEANTAVTTCYDAARIEVSTDGGTVFNPITPSTILLDPYTQTVSSGFMNPLAGSQVWCGFKASTLAAIDLTPFVGQTIKVRFRSASDSSAVATTTSGVTAGWYVDDVRVQSCTSGPADAVFKDGFE